MKAMTLLIIAAVAFSVANAQYNYVRAVPAPIYDDVRDSSGQLSLRYVTDNGISVTETGRLKPLPSATRGGASDYVYVKEGSYSFTSPEGKFYKVNYVADENGYRATGAHLPKAPTFAPYS